MSFTYKLQQRMDVSLKRPFSMLVSRVRDVGRTEFTNKLLISKLIAPHTKALCSVMQSINKICLRRLWKWPRNMRKVSLESWTSISRRTKEISLYRMILWMKHQKVLKLLNCLHVLVMTVFLESVSHKISSIKINALLAKIPITIHDLLLLQDK